MGAITRAVARARPLLAYRTSPANNPTAVVALRGGQRYAGKSSPQLYRDWSWHSEYLRAGLDFLLNQLERAEWDLVPFDIKGPKPDEGMVGRQREILTQPNPGDASFATFIRKAGEDLLCLDAMTIEKERMLKGEIAYLWASDGANILVDRLWDGDPKRPRYVWHPQPDRSADVSLLNEDLIYGMIHSRSNSPVGVGFPEILKMVIESELRASMFNARSVTQAAPDGIMDLGENARPEQVNTFRSFFESEIAGQGMMGFWGGTKGAKFIPFNRNNHEMQYMEWLEYQVRKIAAVLQISVQDIQLTHDINRATGEVQQQNTESRGVKMVLGVVQDYITSEFCWDRGFGGRRNNIAFRFRAVSDQASLQRAEEKKLTVAGLPIQSINQARRDLGWPPIGDPEDENNPFNSLMANTPLGLVRLIDIPTAREVVMAKAKAAPAAGSSSPTATGAKKPAASKQLTEGSTHA